MSIEWDVLLNGVSIRDKITDFQITQDREAYVKELSLSCVSPDFFDSFDFGTLPTLCIEIKTKLSDTWVSHGFFYIERFNFSLAKGQKTTRQLWGRSTTARAGEPFAAKITKTWDQDTTLQSIISEMTVLCDLEVIYEIDDYVVYANAYSVEMAYPIGVIQELCTYAGAFVSCNSSGQLVIKKIIFHHETSDYTITDNEIIEFTESVVFPSFGNRVKIGSLGVGYTVNLVALDNSDCLPADGESTGEVLAFVTDQDGLPVNNISVNWTAESGITIDKEVTITGEYLIDKETVNADNYYKLTVAYPVSDVIGIWKYSDSSHANNLWDTSKEGCVFEGSEISVNDPFIYCNQTLIVSYITAGCAVNKLTAGNQSFDTVVTADVGGAQSSLDIKLGNSCVCGSSLSVRAGSSEVCFGNYTNILVAATINNEPALGYVVRLAGDEGCGEQDSWSGTLGYVNVYSEIATVFNVIPGVSQVKTSMPISDMHNPPRVYRKSSTNPNRYSSHTDQTIDLNYSYETGVELLVYYTAAGASTFRWRPGGSVTTPEDTELYGGGCSSEITVTMADGTEQGLSASINMSSIDCTVVTDDDPEIPEDDDDDPLPEPDPEEPDPFFPVEPVGGLDSGDDGGDDGGDLSGGDDGGDGYPEGSPEDGEGQFPGEGGGALSPDSTSDEGDDSGDSSEDGSEPEAGSSPLGEGESGDPSGGLVTACDGSILTKIVNYDSVIGDEEKEKLRYGYQSSDDCANGFACECSELCESEMYEKGNTYDYPKTIHEQALESGEENSPAYNEAYEQLKTDHLSECESNCESARNAMCGDCIISGPTILTPGESAEYICSDGTVQLITMPLDGCGMVQFTIGCCEFEVRSTVGKWVTTWGTWPWYVRICEVNDGVGIANGTREGYENITMGGVPPVICEVEPPWICGVPCGEDSCADDPSCAHAYRHIGTQQWQC